MSPGSGQGCKGGQSALLTSDTTVNVDEALLTLVLERDIDVAMASMLAIIISSTIMTVFEINAAIKIKRTIEVEINLLLHI